MRGVGVTWYVYSDVWSMTVASKANSEPVESGLGDFHSALLMF